MMVVSGRVVGKMDEAAGRVGRFPPLVQYVHETVVVYFELQYTLWKKSPLLFSRYWRDFLLLFTGRRKH